MTVVSSRKENITKIKTTKKKRSNVELEAVRKSSKHHKTSRGEKQSAEPMPPSGALAGEKKRRLGKAEHQVKARLYRALVS
jgi:hypothetical protein